MSNSHSPSWLKGLLIMAAIYPLPYLTLRFLVPVEQKTFVRPMHFMATGACIDLKFHHNPDSIATKLTPGPLRTVVRGADVVLMAPLCEADVYFTGTGWRL